MLTVLYDINPKILYLSKLLKENYRKALCEEGLFVGQQDILIRILHNEGITSTELAKQIGVSLATISVSVKRLEKADFIEKHSDEKDSRITRLYLTAHGRNVQKNICTTLSDSEKELLNGMSTEEIDFFRETLSKAIINLGGSLEKPCKLPSFLDKEDNNG